MPVNKLKPVFCEEKNSPNELAAVGAEGWLAEECCHELVTIYLVHPPSHGPTPPVESLPLLELPRFHCRVFWNKSPCYTLAVQNVSQCHFATYWPHCDG
jgi:hypothetical protein